MNGQRRCGRWRAAAAKAAVFVIGLSACNATHLAPYKNGASSNTIITPYARVIEVEIHRQYFTDRPDCVLLLPISGSARQTPLSTLLERYLALHLRFRFDRVILASEDARRMFRVGQAPSRPDNRRQFHDATACDYEVVIRLIHARADFAMVWAQLSLGLEAQLSRTRDGLVLWKARHTATRSDGGIAISPFGAASSAVEAMAFVSDGDHFVSLAADVTRRVVATLPPQDQEYKAYCRGKASSFERLCGLPSVEMRGSEPVTKQNVTPNQQRAFQNRSIIHR